MFIDDSLAKGITKRLIEQFDAEIENASSTFKKSTHFISLEKRTNYEKILKFHKDAFENISFCYIQGGSKRHPYIAYNLPTYWKNREYEEWTENSIHGSINLKRLPEWDFNRHYYGSSFLIVEHALKRIVQRANLIDDLIEIDSSRFMNELKYLPIWAGFILFFLSDVKFPLGFDTRLLSASVPTPNGILLCKINRLESGAHFLEVRTFVELDKLSDEQKDLRESLLDVSQGLESSILCFFPYHESLTKNVKFELYETYTILLFRLKDSIYELSNSFLENHDDFSIYELSKLITEYFSKKLNNFDLNEIGNSDRRLKEVGYINFMIEFSATL